MQKYSLADRLILVFCRMEPAGLSPWAPGTMGSLLAMLLAPFIFMPLNLWWRLAVLAAVFVAGGIASTRAEKVLGRKDPGSVVIDELLGQWIVFLPYTSLVLWELIVGFVLFRIFDIAKPWPVRASEDWMPGGFGIMIDDFFAGIYALVSFYLLREYLVPFVG